VSEGVAITAFDMVTAYGRGVDLFWDALLDRRSAIAGPRRACQGRFEMPVVAESVLVDLACSDTALWQLCQVLLDHPVLKDIPAGTELDLASTVGEIELLERAVDQGSDAVESGLSRLALKVGKHLGFPEGAGTVVSAACASGTAAMALASNRIRLGLSKSALIVACDVVSEFTLAGFGSLMALDKQGARPFDKARAGLSLGDGAAFMLLTAASHAREKGLPVLAGVAGWGMSDDANHITGPSRDGAGLAGAIDAAIRTAGVCAGDIAFISAHGTGTLYNDAMEMKAFKKVFSQPVPVYGVKGAIGHTLGAAGLIEAGLVAHAFKAACVPSTVGLSEPDPEALGWVSTQARPATGDHALCVNAGFGGINAAICLRKCVGSR
jgi:3-oxoacyl-[acyl-carrier-protein] synthase II